jgi:hypothetical protein
MNKNKPSPRLFSSASSLPSAVRLVFGALLMAGACAAAGAADFTGRGIFNFQSGSGCPFGAALAGGSNASGNEACNRLALDDTDTRATLDNAAHTIRFANTRLYGEKTVVGDVLLQGSGRAQDGQRVPLSFHMLLSRAGDSWSVSRHAHAPVKGDFDDIRVDPYQVAVSGADGSEHVVLTAAQIVETLARPSLAARVVNGLVQVRDSRMPMASGTPGMQQQPEADITIALGLGRATKSVARARLRVEPVKAQGLNEALQQGSWSLELQALSGQIPREVVQRDFFLFGLEAQPQLQSLLQRSFRKRESLVLGAVNGKGYLRYDGQQRDFPGADDAARAFLQDSFIGLILGWQQEQQQRPVQAARSSDGR